MNAMQPTTTEPAFPSSIDPRAFYLVSYDESFGEAPECLFSVPLAAWIDANEIEAEIASEEDPDPVLFEALELHKRGVGASVDFEGGRLTITGPAAFFELCGEWYSTDRETVEVLSPLVEAARATGDSSAVMAVLSAGVHQGRIWPLVCSEVA